MKNLIVIMFAVLFVAFGSALAQTARRQTKAAPKKTPHSFSWGASKHKKGRAVGWSWGKRKNLKKRGPKVGNAAFDTFLKRKQSSGKHPGTNAKQQTNNLKQQKAGRTATRPHSTSGKVLPKSAKPRKSAVYHPDEKPKAPGKN